MAISKGLYNQLRIETKNRCGYSLTSTWVTGEPLTIEHIFPVARGGTDDRSNLWLSCRRCNQYKRTLTEATDPDTGQIVPFFNPRRQLWYDHFTWSGAGIHIIGLTTMGRATALTLQVNHPDILEARRLWVQVGWHPPKE